MFIFILTMTLFVISIIAILYITFLIKNKNKINHDRDNNQINETKLNKELKWLKEAFNGERKKDCQVFFINKNDVADVKLAYELLSAKKAVERDNITNDYDEIDLDLQDKYCKYQITFDNTLDIYDYTDENLALYARLLDKKYEIKESQEKFMKESNFDEKDLVAYYKAIIEAKKIDDDEVKNIAKTYFTMVNQLYRLTTLNRSEKVNEVISKSHITQGFDQSQLKKELNELLKN